MRISLIEVIENIVKEQSNVRVSLAANDSKLDATVRKYCTPVLADKGSIDLQYNNQLSKEVIEQINDKFDDIVTAISRNSTNKLLTGALTKNIPEIKNLISQPILTNLKQGFYAQYQLEKPLNYGVFVSTISKIILDNVMKNIQSQIERPGIKILANAYITKENYQQIIKEGYIIFDSYVTEIKKFIDVLLMYIKRASHGVKPQESKVCDKVVITLDYNYNPLPPDKQYSPYVPVQMNPNYITNNNEFNWSSFTAPYKTQLSALIQKSI